MSNCLSLRLLGWKKFFSASCYSFDFAPFDVVNDEFFVGVVGDFFAVRQNQFAGFVLGAENENFLYFTWVKDSAAKHKGFACKIGIDK
jgi:hypothetical protein